MRKFTSIVLISLIIIFLYSTVNYAQSNSINIYYFNSKSCSYCVEEAAFLKNLKKKYKNVNIYDFEITTNHENGELLEQVIKKLNVEVPAIPFTVVGDKYFAGWVSEEVTGNFIEQAVENQIQNGPNNYIEDLLTSNNITKNTIKSDLIPEKLKFPFIGEVQTKNLSLQLLTIVFALVDGFNPCAMWVLLFLISLLIGMQDKKKMWILGFIFIFTSAASYYLFMIAWLNIFLFLSFVPWVKFFIGGVALAAGFYSLKLFFHDKSNGCPIIGETRRQKVFEKTKQILSEKHLLISAIGIILLAFSVNLVELLCSAGLPAVYTQILTMNTLSPWQHHSYLLLYVFIFMLDDLFIFLVAMITLEVTGISTKYLKVTKFVSSIIMIIIGLLIIIKPEMLAFK